MPKGKHLDPAIGANTQFGKPGGPDPSIATRTGVPKWSIRKQLAYLAAQNVDLNDKNAMKNLLGDNPTVAQVIAAAALIKASKGQMDAVSYATENIDGKLPQTNINAEYEAIRDASDEDLDAIIAAGLGHQARTGAGDIGKESATGAEGKGVGAVSRSSNRGAKKRS